MKILSLITHPHVVPNPKEKKLLNKVIFVFLALKDYSRSFIKLRLNPRWTILMMSILPFWALNMSVALLSMQGQKILGFHQKYLNLCSEDERKSYRFGITWRWVINDRTFFGGWTLMKTQHHVKSVSSRVNSNISDQLKPVCEIPDHMDS